MERSKARNKKPPRRAGPARARTARAKASGPLRALASKAPVRKVAADVEVLVEGRPVDRLLMLRSGAVEILKGGVRVAFEDAPGGLYGEMSLLLAQPASATVRTTAPSEFWEFPCEESFLVRQPRLALEIGRLLARRLQAATRYLADVREQFAAFDDHVGMVDKVMEAMVMRNPRRVDRRLANDPNAE